MWSVLLLAAWLLLPGLVVRPDPTLTPGAVASTNTREVCAVGYAGKHRNVSDKTKRAVYAAYGIPITGRFRTSKAGTRVWQSDNEVDHLIALELGGSNALTNLWIESYGTKTYNAHTKDALERILRSLVCSGQVPLAQAQTEMAADWIAAYHRYVK